MKITSNANSGKTLYATLSKKWVEYVIMTECVEKPLTNDESRSLERRNPRGEYFQKRNIIPQ
jgi:hypothetical protein